MWLALLFVWVWCLCDVLWLTPTAICDGIRVGLGRVIYSADEVTVDKGNFEIVPWPVQGQRHVPPIHSLVLSCLLFLFLSLVFYFLSESFCCSFMVCTSGWVRLQKHRVCDTKVHTDPPL